MNCLEFYWAEYKYYEILYHGSDCSVGMLDLGWARCDTACLIVYRKGNSNLPFESVTTKEK